MFKIAKAEFIKIFKKPTVYIMALFLIGVFLSSLYTFKPESRGDYQVYYTGALSANQVYTQYDTTDSKDSKTYFENQIQNTYNINDYYGKVYKQTQLKNEQFDKLKLLIASSTDSDKIKEQFVLLKDSILNFDAYYISADGYNPPENLKELFKYNDYVNVYIPTLFTLINQYAIEIQTLPTSADIVKYYNTKNVQDNLEIAITKSNEIINILFEKVISDLNTDIKNFVTAYTITSDGDITKYVNLIKKIQTNLNQAKVIFTDLFESDQLIFLTPKTFLDEINLIVNRLISSVNYNESLLNNKTIISNIFSVISKDNYANDFSKITKELKIYTISGEYHKQYNAIFEQVGKCQTTIIKDIELSKNDTTTNDIYNKILNHYYLNESYFNLTNALLTQDIKSQYNGNIADLNYKSAYMDNDYQLSETITLNKYYIDNNIYQNSFSTPFNYGVNSYTETNAYDFMYYSLQICVLFIILFTIMMVITIISSESSNGTIKLLLMRPFKRKKILSGKILATLIFSSLFLLLISIVSYIGGIVVFDAKSTDALIIFNASTPIVMNPLYLMLIYIGSLFLEILLFLVLAVFACIVFNSMVGSLISSLILFMGAKAMSISFAANNILTYSPLSNISLFKFFSRSTLSGTPSLLFQTLFASNTSFVISGILYVSTLVILLITAHSVFKHRDY